VNKKLGGLLTNLGGRLINTLSNIQCPIYNVQYTMSNIQYPMSNVQYPMSNIAKTIHHTLFISANPSFPTEEHPAGEHRRRPGDLPPHPGHPRPLVLAQGRHQPLHPLPAPPRLHEPRLRHRRPAQPAQRDPGARVQGHAPLHARHLLLEPLPVLSQPGCGEGRARQAAQCGARRG
jgi:hypothetical protein